MLVIKLKLKFTKFRKSFLQFIKLCRKGNSN